MYRYARLLHARRALPCLARARASITGQVAPRQLATAVEASPGRQRHSSGRSDICGSSVAAAAALACLSLLEYTSASDDSNADGREKIIWVDAHGKKVRVVHTDTAHDPILELRCDDPCLVGEPGKVYEVYPH